MQNPYFTGRSVPVSSRLDERALSDALGRHNDLEQRRLGYAQQTGVQLAKAFQEIEAKKQKKATEDAAVNFLGAMQSRMGGNLDEKTLRQGVKSVGVDKVANLMGAFEEQARKQQQSGIIVESMDTTPKGKRFNEQKFFEGAQAMGIAPEKQAKIAKTLKDIEDQQVYEPSIYEVPRPDGEKELVLMTSKGSGQLIQDKVFRPTATIQEKNHLIKSLIKEDLAGSVPLFKKLVASDMENQLGGFLQPDGSFRFTLEGMRERLGIGEDEMMSPDDDEVPAPEVPEDVSSIVPEDDPAEIIREADETLDDIIQRW